MKTVLFLNVILASDNLIIAANKGCRQEMETFAQNMNAGNTLKLTVLSNVKIYKTHIRNSYQNSNNRRCR